MLGLCGDNEVEGRKEAKERKSELSMFIMYHSKTVHLLSMSKMYIQGILHYQIAVVHKFTSELCTLGKRLGGLQ